MAVGENMILSFSVFKDKLESGEKCQTIRKYSPQQYQKFLNTWYRRQTNGRYNLYWHNPRNGGVRIKDVVPSDSPFLIFFERVNNVILCWPVSSGDLQPFGRNVNDLAQKDGFTDFQEMANWFFNEYGEAMFTEKFIVLRWHPMEMRGEVK